MMMMLVAIIFGDCNAGIVLFPFLSLGSEYTQQGCVAQQNAHLIPQRVAPASPSGQPWALILFTTRVCVYLEKRSFAVYVATEKCCHFVRTRSFEDNIHSKKVKLSLWNPWRCTTCINPYLAPFHTDFRLSGYLRFYQVNAIRKIIFLVVL